MQTVMPIYGTRPEAIKVAPLISLLRSTSELDCVVTVTGQHREMLDQVNSLFGIKPDFDLDVIQPRQTLNGVLAKTVARLDSILREVRPSAVVVQGDTTTSTAGAIAAFYSRIPVIHLEAGLRSFNRHSPFPEEANRRLTSQVTSLHLAPTLGSKDNLLREGIDSADVVVTGNTVIDALLDVVQRPQAFEDKRLQRLADARDRIVLVTTHRRENLGGAMAGIGRAVARLAQRYPSTHFLVPLHKNPAVREVLLPILTRHENILLTEPLPYSEFTHAMAMAHIVVTDSGGVQEEAPSLGKPVLVMRENTERPEAVDAGTVRIIGTAEDRIYSETVDLLDNPTTYALMANAVNPYGDGLAAQRSVAAIAQLLGVGSRLPDFDPLQTLSTSVPSEKV
jgi:UDP-N-acetylglucosamine 2-epimerase (non-hydrolysing)